MSNPVIGMSEWDFAGGFNIFRTFENVERVNDFFNKSNRTLNFLAVIPIAGIVTSALRGIAGVIMCLAAAVLRLVALIGMAVAKGQRDSLAYMKWSLLDYLGKEYMTQGGLEVIRGFSQTVVCAATLGVGNLLFVIPNAREGKKWFEPRVPYETAEETATNWALSMQGVIA